MPHNPSKTGRKLPVFKTYIQETLRYPWLLAGTVIGVLGVQAADLISPLYLKQFFNILGNVAPGSQAAGELFAVLLAIAIISLGRWITLRIETFSVMHTEAKVMARLYSRSFLYLIQHSYHFFISQFTGTLTRRVSKFANAYETIFDDVAMQFIPTALFMVGAITILYLRNHILGVALGLWTLCFVAFQIFVAKLRQPIRAHRSEEDSRMVGSLADAISNQTTITLFSGVADENSRFAQAISHWKAATMRSWITDEYIWSAQGLLMVAINIGLLYGAIFYWKQGLLTIGDFVLIQTYLLGSFDRLNSINRELRRLYDAYADAAEMAEILETPHGVQDAAGAKPLETTSCRVEFKNVGFYFHKNRTILKNLDITIESREKLALVGPSGAGKTTITKLLLRLYDITEGAIEIDGQNIAGVTQESLRNAISFVPQEPVLFHRTLMENIRYGKRDATDDEVMDSAKKAHCHEFIASLPDGYETFVGERGVKLSGGERQRVAIARALLKNAPILVLDEATSSLDSESEALIQDALQTLMKDKTVIVIAHRLSTIMKMDRIIVLENGAVVAVGTHEELLEHKGLYHKLWSIQAGGFTDLNANRFLENDVSGEEAPGEERVTKTRTA
jgi:ATP-binding cassette, subfamily B, bacterial